MRKQVLEYDDVANDQRKVIYHQRNEILTSKDVSDLTREIRADVISDLVDYHIPPDSMEEQWDIPALEHQLAADFRLHVDIKGWLKEDSTLDNQDIKERLIKRIEDEYAEKVELVGKQAMSDFERNVMLQVIDNQWREHLAAMDYLRQGIHLRSYAQKKSETGIQNAKLSPCLKTCGAASNKNIAALLTAVKSSATANTTTLPHKASAMFKPSTPMRLIWKNCSVNRKPIWLPKHSTQTAQTSAPKRLHKTA